MLFATTALGLGLDIPDIKTVVIYGLCDLDEMFQQGGRAGRDGKTEGSVIWLIEPWAFKTQRRDKEKPSSQEERVSKKQAADEEKRLRMDPNTRAFIDCSESQSNRCMRAFLCDYFRPKPNRPGFPWYARPESGDEEEDGALPGTSIEWEVANQVVTLGADCGCNAHCCRINPEVGLLTGEDRARIQRAMETLQPPATVSSSAFPNPTRLRCSKPERDGLKEQLEHWRDHEWALIGERYPYYSRDWVLSDEDLKRIVDKAHIVLSAPSITQAFLSDISRWIPTSPCLDSLLVLLEDFRVARQERDAVEALERPRKRINRDVVRDSLIDPFIQGVESQPFNVNPPPLSFEAGMEFSWHISME